MSMSTLIIVGGTSYTAKTSPARGTGCTGCTGCVAISDVKLCLMLPSCVYPALVIFVDAKQ